MEKILVEGESFTLYNKCLFKTIDYCTLKSELLKRKVYFMPNDTYRALTFRLRLDILKSDPKQTVLVKDLKRELDSLTANKRNEGKLYFCKINGCLYSSANYRKYLAHLDLVHRKSKSRFCCQFRHECLREFSTVLLLKDHLNSVHFRRTSSVQLKQRQLVQDLTVLKCGESSCGNQSVTSIRELKKHLYAVHTVKKEEVTCLFCSFRTNVTSTLQSHFSRKHKVQTPDLLNTNLMSISEDNDQVVNDSTFEDNYFETRSQCDEILDGVERDSYSPDSEVLTSNIDEMKALEEEADDFDEENCKLFVRALAITFNSWMNVKGIAWSTVNSIVTEVFESYRKGVEFTKSKIRRKLLESGIREDEVKVIMSAAEIMDPIELARKELETESSRKNFICSSFPYVKPVTIRLGPGKSDIMHYVPIKDSLKNLLEDQSFIDQRNEDPYYFEPNIIKDIRDGSCFKENEFFRVNPDALPLIAFADELEVCNPLGSGKTRHKINCTYFTTTEIQPPLRTKVNSVQLVSLVLSRVWKKYGTPVCNKNFIDDLHDLEDEGIVVSTPVTRTVKAGLLYFLGDNLGQHSLAEMSTSFSSGYICRWCQCEYKEVCLENKPYPQCQSGFNPAAWTAEVYDDIVRGENAISDNTFGVKGECAFNKLQSFHCINQLPPCIGKMQSNCSIT